MHASFFTVAFLLSLSLVPISALPTGAGGGGGDQHPHHLERRFVNPLTIGLGAGGVHKAKDNEHLAADLDAQIHEIRTEVERLKATEVTLARSGVAPNLVRRQLGTILGAVGIHKSKHTRKEIDRMRGETEALRHDVNVLLQAEHLPAHAGPHEAFDGEEVAAHHEGGDDDMDGPEEAGGPDESGDEHRLVRRQLGIILGPVAIHKAKKDRAALEALRPEIDHLRVDCARIRTAQEQRLRNLNAMRNGNFAGAGFGGPVIGRGFNGPNHVIDTRVDVIIPPGRVHPGNGNGVLGDHEDRYDGGHHEEPHHEEPYHHHHEEPHHEEPHHHDRHSAYGRRTY